MHSHQPSTPQIFQPAYYQRIHDTERGHWWAMGMRDLMAAWLDKALTNAEKLRALDVGCGTGFVLEWLQRYPLLHEPVGIDLSAHALAFGKRRATAALALASADHLPLPLHYFDLIVCLDTLQHLSPAGADQESLQWLGRHLRPGGYLYLRTNSALGHVALHGVDPNLYRRYRREELVQMVTQAGLRVERSSYANCLMSGWAWWKEGLSGDRPSAPIGPGLAIRPLRFNALNTLLHGLLRLEAWLAGPLGLQLPFGHSIVILARKP